MLGMDHDFEVTEEKPRFDSKSRLCTSIRVIILKELLLKITENSKYFNKWMNW